MLTFPTKLDAFNFGLWLDVHPNLLYANSDGSGESAHKRRLARAFVSQQCDMYRNNDELNTKMAHNLIRKIRVLRTLRTIESYFVASTS